jgi:hypothetical protein
MTVHCTLSCRYSVEPSKKPIPIGFLYPENRPTVVVLKGRFRFSRFRSFFPTLVGFFPDFGQFWRQSEKKSDTLELFSEFDPNYSNDGYVADNLSILHVPFEHAVFMQRMRSELYGTANLFTNVGGILCLCQVATVDGGTKR